MVLAGRATAPWRFGTVSFWLHLSLVLVVAVCGRGGVAVVVGDSITLPSFLKGIGYWFHSAQAVRIAVPPDSSHGGCCLRHCHCHLMPPLESIQAMKNAQHGPHSHSNGYSYYWRFQGNWIPGHSSRHDYSYSE